MGSATESGGNYTVRGAGNDIWYATDQFHFVYQPISGDADIRAYVAGVEYVHPWTKAGVMIRATLDPSSPHASTFVTAANGLAFQRRVAAGGASTSTAAGAAAAPYWVRVVRAGQLFTSYVSANGTDWTLVSSETIAMPADVFVGLAVVSKDPARTAMATFSNVAVGATAPETTEPPATEPPATEPPAEPQAAVVTGTWTNTDVGGPVVAGRASQSSGTFSVSGAGGDIWYQWDEFHFMYLPVSGDVEIVARVVSIERAHDWSKAGVMIRETLGGASAHGFMTGSAAKGWSFQRRPSSGSPSVSSPGSLGVAPGWVRLVRSGNTFSGYESTNGSNWVLVGTETIPMAASVYVGLAVTSHNTAVTSTATFTDVSVTTPTVGNASPSVTLTAPANGSTFNAPASIALSANASDSDGTVARVDFIANGQVVGTDTTTPYQATWSNVAQGSYNVRAVATDNAGATTTSGTATVTVNAAAANQPPTVSITSPANGASFASPSSITINANAADSNGTVSQVQFFQGTQLLGTDTSAPYSYVWNSPIGGSYSLTAVATDNNGASTTSAAVNITVTTTGNQAPTVSITSPANGATFAAPASITITANAVDSDGTVARVDFFYNGSRYLYSDSSAPYSYTWNNVAAGTYTLVVTARDNNNLRRDSATITITVGSSSSNTPPTVAITSPTNGASFTAPANITINANAADSNGTVSQVDFFRSGTLIGSDTTAPYSVTWSSAPAGTYSLTAIARDNGGAATTSAAVSITVGSAPAPTTTVVFNPSPDHNVDVTGYAVSIFRAGDNPATATPASTKNIGKPTPSAANEISADVTDIVNPLPAGSYFVVVTVTGSGGSSQSAPSGNFTK